jgi:hypothetical protein
LRFGSRLEIMPFVLRGRITNSIFAFAAIEYEFLLTVSDQIKYELLKMNDAKFMDIVHWRYTEVAKQAAKVVTLNKAFINCFKIIHKLSQQIFNIILATKFSR